MALERNRGVRYLGSSPAQLLFSWQISSSSEFCLFIYEMDFRTGPKLDHTQKALSSAQPVVGAL